MERLSASDKEKKALTVKHFIATFHRIQINTHSSFNILHHQRIEVMRKFQGPLILAIFLFGTLPLLKFSYKNNIGILGVLGTSVHSHTIRAGNFMLHYESLFIVCVLLIIILPNCKFK